MKYYLICETPHGNVLLKIKADNEGYAKGFALQKYQIKSVLHVTTTKPEFNIHKITVKHNPFARSSYPYIKNTGKSFVRIYT